MKNTKEREKGITLISLVITIIILLILAGITITQLTGSGLFEKAKIAKIYSREAEAEEQISIEILRIQTDKEGTCTIQEIYDDFSSIKNEKIDVIQVNTETLDNNKIKEIIVIVKGYEEFSFTIGEDLSIKEICEIAKKDWKGETLEDMYSNLENSLAININSGKLTEGTTISVNAKQLSKIKKIEIQIGDITVYKEENLDKNIYMKTINVKEMQSLADLKFKQSYNTKIKVTLLNGNVLEENGKDIINYTVGNAENLKEFTNQVNGGDRFEGETILQIADIDLSSVCNATVGTWIPIGRVSATTNTWFDGTYNGDKKNIKNLYINNNDEYTPIGLFGFLGYRGIIKNIVLYGEVIQNANVDRAVGAIVGRNEGIIENCVNYANVISNSFYYASGIAGGNSNIVRNCINNGNIIGVQYIGGICSFMNNDYVISNSKIEKTIISNCINNGIISGEAYVGGIVGTIRNGTIELCENTGNVTTLSSIVGGISGETSGDVVNCKNKGDITSKGNPNNQKETQATGGIVGRSTANISYSSNEGNITSKGYFCGGILGVGSENTIIEQCYNKGSIEIEQNAAGGIVGLDAKSIINCYNYIDTNKTITANYNVGGIIGNMSIYNAEINNCYSIGENITGSSNASIIGSFFTTGIKVNNCYYLDTSTLDGLGNNTAGNELTINNIHRKSISDFKLSVNENNSVSYLLNTNNGSGIWGQSSEINDGFPYLINNN